MKIEEIFSVKDKVALITGGSRGVGEMIASAYLANGAKVYITARKAEACDNNAGELSEKYNAECISIPNNASSLEGIQELFEEINQKESIGITGKSGSGKSTLLDLLTGIIKPKEGDIFISGENINN